MADDPPVRARRALLDDDDEGATLVLPAISGRPGPRRSVTPDWDLEDDLDGDLDEDDEDDAQPVRGARAATATPRWPTPARAAPPAPRADPHPAHRSAEPVDDHARFRPPARDADTVVIRRGDLAAVLHHATPPRAEPVRTDSATPSWTPVPRAAAPAPATDPTPSPAPDDGSESAPASPEPVARTTVARRPRWLIPVALVAALALVVYLAVSWLGGARSPESVASTAVSPSGRAVLTEADLVGIIDASLAVPTGWTVSSTDFPVTDTLVAPICVAPLAMGPTPTISYQRKLTGPPTASLVHRAEAYATPGDAMTVAALRAAQLGRCATVPVHLSQGASVTGVGDEAVAVQVVVQNPTPVHHTVVVARTGTVVNVIDVSQPTTAIPFEKALGPVGAVVAKQCARAGGACVTTATVTPGAPPASGIAGWLTSADLPRITPGAGRWTVGEPSGTVRLAGTGCENVEFSSVPGPKQRLQRSYVLADDAVPTGFGLDELLLDFGTPAEATAFAQTLNDNIVNCPTRTAGVTLGASGTVTGTEAGVALAGTWRTVTQPESTRLFRVGIVTAGTRVAYVVLTPTVAFNYSDEAWSALTLRAAQRAAQQS